MQDVIGDGADTLALAQGFARYAKPDYRYMFVLQGKDMYEVLHCLRVVSNSVWAVYITTLGIPRHLTTTINLHFRVNLLEFLLNEQVDKQFDLHFLGGSPWMREVVLLAELAQGSPGVRGIDTSTPIYMGARGLDIAKDEYIRRPDDYFDLTFDHTMIEENVNTYLDWAQYNASV